jgi:magnesium chelatase subunit I
VIAQELIRRAADATFQERAAGLNTDDIVMWFDTGNALQVSEDVSSGAMVEGFARVPGLIDLIADGGFADDGDAPTVAAACELALEALVARRKISRSDAGTYGRAVPPERRRPPAPEF